MAAPAARSSETVRQSGPAQPRVAARRSSTTRSTRSRPRPDLVARLRLEEEEQAAGELAAMADRAQRLEVDGAQDARLGDLGPDRAGEDRADAAVRRGRRADPGGLDLVQQREQPLAPAALVGEGHAVGRGLEPLDAVAQLLGGAAAPAHAQRRDEAAQAGLDDRRGSRLAAPEAEQAGEDHGLEGAGRAEAAGLDGQRAAQVVDAEGVAAGAGRERPEAALGEQPRRESGREGRGVGRRAGEEDGVEVVLLAGVVGRPRPRLQGGVDDELDAGDAGRRGPAPKLVVVAPRHQAADELVRQRQHAAGTLLGRRRSRARRRRPAAAARRPSSEAGVGRICADSAALARPRAGHGSGPQSGRLQGLSTHEGTDEPSVPSWDLW